jgi:hypothetical protein
MDLPRFSLLFLIAVRCTPKEILRHTCHHTSSAQEDGFPGGRKAVFVERMGSRRMTGSKEGFRIAYRFSFFGIFIPKL